MVCHSRLIRKFISPLYHIFLAGCLAQDENTRVMACLAGCGIARGSMENSEMAQMKMEAMDENHNTREGLEKNDFEAIQPTEVHTIVSETNL